MPAHFDSSRRSLLQGASALLTAGCAARPSSPTEDAARPRRRVEFAKLSGADLVWLHAAMQMDAAGTQNGLDPDRMKSYLGRDFVPEEGRTEILLRTARDERAARAVYAQRFDEVVVAKAADWHNVEFTIETRLNADGSNVLDAKVDSLWRDGFIGYSAELPLFDTPSRDPRDWRKRRTVWTDGPARPNYALEVGLNDGSRGSVIVKGWADLHVRVPFQLEALQKLIAAKLHSDPQGRDLRSSRLLRIDGDISVTLRPQRVYHFRNSLGQRDERIDAGYGKLQMVATIDRLANVTVS